MMTDRTVLALDLSSARGVIAVVRGDEVLFESVFQSERSHNAQVFAPLTKALAVIGKAEATIAVGTGPGSYTGVRISIAAAQGLALSRGWPVMGWPSITTVGLPEYRVLGDARRGHFYTAEVKAGRLVTATEVVTADEARAAVADGRVWVTLDPKVPLGLEQVARYEPDAVTLGRIVAELSDEELAIHAALLLEPIYLQEAFITVAKKIGKSVPNALNA